MIYSIICQELSVLVVVRRQRVLDLVHEQGFARLTDLARTLHVSESTLRRDLDHWDRQGFLKRIHGGAMYTGDGSSLPALEERSTSQIVEKRAIARTAAA